LGQSASEQVLARVFGAITDAMAAGEKVTLVGFGPFSVSERAAPVKDAILSPEKP
jgi:nucleoid DNA-binding protein